MQLEPNIDARTMEIHHGKHINGYVPTWTMPSQQTELEGKTLKNF